MPAKLIHVRSLPPLLLLFLLLFLAGSSSGQQQPAATLPPAEAQTLVQRALATELRTAQDPDHPMRYRLRKTSPRLTSTKEILETKDGDVARLVALFDKPLTPEGEQKEQARLDTLLNDPSLQRHRKQGEQGDMGIVLKLLRMLPDAFLYQYAGPSDTVQKFTFRPNPKFSPPDFETQALTAMSGMLLVDDSQQRVARLEGHLQQDTDYLWGALAKLDKGGSVVIEQSDVGGHQWRIARFQMQMNMRILFKTRNIDTTEEMTQYLPVPTGLDYRQAIQMLRAGSTNANQPSR
ncbi:MAG: hypothetical protein WBQ94_17575 [Terracidiphilus sp.]